MFVTNVCSVEGSCCNLSQIPEDKQSRGYLSALCYERYVGLYQPYRNIVGHSTHNGMQGDVSRHEMRAHINSGNFRNYCKYLTSEKRQQEHREIRRER
jgi:hypothetical protein